LTISISVTTKDETLRYGPFVQAFNIALDMLADLDVPLNPANKIMFHHNDPIAVMGHHDLAESGRQPDVVLGKEQVLRLGREDTEDLTNGIRPSLPFSWNHVFSCEFKATSAIMEKPPPAYTYSPCPGTVTMPGIPTDIYESATPTSSTISSWVPPPKLHP